MGEDGKLKAIRAHRCISAAYEELLSVRTRRAFTKLYKLLHIE